MKARGWANPGSRSSCSSPTPTHTPSGSHRPEPPWQPAVEGSKRLGKGQPAATPRKPRPTLTSVRGLSGWLWRSRCMEDKNWREDFRHCGPQVPRGPLRCLEEPGCCSSPLPLYRAHWPNEGTGPWRQAQKPDCGLERGPQRCGE